MFYGTPVFLAVPRQTDGVVIRVIATSITHIEPRGSGSILHFVGRGMLETKLSAEKMEEMILDATRHPLIIAKKSISQDETDQTESE